MTNTPQTTDFADIAHLIAQAKQRAVQAVNITLIELYWTIGQRISREIAAAEWAMAWWNNWHAIWRKPSRGCEGLPAPICSA